MVYLGYINLLALPYTIYSIGYQVRAKVWCILCCTVQAVLWLEAVGFFFHGYASFSELVSLRENLLPIFICFVAPIAIWSFLKPFFNKSAQLVPTAQQLNRFKYDSDLFQRTLHSKARFALGVDLQPLTVGNSGAENIITMVSNPFCNPCGKAQRIIEEWLEFRDDIQLKVVFLTGNHHEDPRTMVAGHVSALMLDRSIEDALVALSDWYKQSDRNIEAWKKRFPIGEEVMTREILEKHNQWCSMVDISYTPTIFVNGYKLPAPYRLEDLKYLLE